MNNERKKAQLEAQISAWEGIEVKVQEKVDKAQAEVDQAQSQVDERERALEACQDS